jgi:FMN phosphatase YigB (HAD superfamily)
MDPVSILIHFGFMEVQSTVMPQTRIVFFDLGDTLGVPRLDAAGGIAGFDIFPFVAEVLAKMKLEARLGVISNTPNGVTKASMSAILAASGILTFFDPVLLLFSSVEGMDKRQKAFFTLAAHRAAVDEGRCIFVGESDAERSVASSAGMKVAFHPLQAFDVLKKLLV